MTLEDVKMEAKREDVKTEVKAEVKVEHRASSCENQGCFSAL